MLRPGRVRLLGAIGRLGLRLGTSEPEASDWRDDNPGDPVDLACRLRAAAQALRTMEVPAVAADLFDDILTPESYADLFDDLAAKAGPDR